MQSRHPRAPEVAREFGAMCKLIDGMYHIYNGVTQEEFDDALAELEAAGPAKINYAAYDHIQSEGHGRDFT